MGERDCMNITFKHLLDGDIEIISEDRTIVYKATVAELLQLAILEKLEEVRCCIIDVENAVERQR